MLRRTPFVAEQWYHIYSRGIDKRVIFHDEKDFERFTKLLYLGNDTKEINLEYLKEVPYQDTFSLQRTQPIIAIGAYCLMENHPHLVVQEKTQGGITRFMRKIGTAYTMYFNKKYERIGNLMVRPFRSKHIPDDLYLRRVVQYVHLNPAEIFEKGWKNGMTQNIAELERKLLNYKYSSLPDYFDTDKRDERAILDSEAVTLIGDGLPPLRDILEEASLYYRDVDSSFEPKPRGRPKTK